MSFSFFRVSTTVSFSRHALIASAATLLPTLASAQNGTVTGAVTNSATLAPVQNATVALCREISAGGNNCVGAVTDASGEYSRTLAPGTYYAYTSDTGLINEIYDNLPCAGSTCESTTAIATGTPIVVAAGATVSGRNFELDPGGSISGAVTDAATGAPIEGVSVEVVMRLGSGSTLFVGSNSTDAAGVYTLAGLPTGTYYAATSNSLGYTNEIYDNILCLATCDAGLTARSGAGISVVNGQTTAGKSFALDVGGTITGTILNSLTSAPAQTLNVVVYTRIGDSLSRVANDFTDASGVYTVRGLPAATYYVATSASSGFFLVNEIYDNMPCAGPCSPALPNPGTPVPVSLGNTVAGIDFQLDPGGSVTGMVIDAATSLPLSGVSVGIYRQVGTLVHAVANRFTNLAGIYTVAGLPAGTYFAAADAPSHIDEVYDNIVCGASCSSSAILGGTPIAVVAGAVTSGRDFALDAGGGIAGTVTSTATSAPLANAEISVYSRVGNHPQYSALFAGSTSTNSTGGWAVTGLPTGEYYAFTSTSSTGLRLADQIHDGKPCATTCGPLTAVLEGTAIGVTTGALTTGINFALAPSRFPPSAPTNFVATVSGFVARLSWSMPSFGAIPTGYVIEAGLTRGSPLIRFSTTATSIDIPGVPPGRFYVRVRAVNGFGIGLPSNENVLIVNADGSGVLGVPESFAARMNGRRLTVTWADPVPGGVAASYVLEVGTAAGLSNIVALPVATRSFTFEPVPNGVYFIRVRSRSGAHVSPPSAEAMIVVGDVASQPEAPRNLFHTRSGFGSTLTLTWLPPYFGTPTSYIIEAGTVSGLSDIAIFNTGSTALTASFTGVPPGTYYVRVRAVNALGASVASNELVVVF